MIVYYMYDYVEGRKTDLKDGLAARQMKQARQKQIYREFDEDIREAMDAVSMSEYLGETK